MLFATGRHLGFICSEEAGVEAKMAGCNEKRSFSTVLRKIGDCEESIFLVFYWPPTDFVSVYKNANMNKTNIQSP